MTSLHTVSLISPSAANLIDSFTLALRAAGRKDKTVRTYLQAVTYLAKYTQEKYMPSLTDLTTEHLREYFGSLYARSLQPRAVSVYYRALQQFFKWLVAEGERPDNPLARVPAPRLNRKLQPHYEPEEVERVLARLPTTTKDVRLLRSRAIVLTLFDTGLRASELCALDRGNLNFRDMSLTVRKAKGDKERRVGLSATTAQAIDRYLRNRKDTLPCLFPAQGGAPLTHNGLRMLLERLWKEAGLQFRGVHAFRRGFAIAFLKAGGHPGDLQTLAGWESDSMVRLYTQATEMSRALEAHKRFSPVDQLRRR